MNLQKILEEERKKIIDDLDDTHREYEESANYGKWETEAEQILTTHDHRILSALLEEIEGRKKHAVERKNDIENDPFHPVRCQYLGQETALTDITTIIKKALK